MKADILSKQYLSVRNKTVEICSPLQIEDYVIQPVTEVSPPKWHLGHTTWFFEELLLVPYLKGYSRFNRHYGRLFNSYYKAAGVHWLQKDRGNLSRPTVAEVLQYRDYVDQSMTKLLQQQDIDAPINAVLEIGLHHEQQHQELLYMDIKYILASNPAFPAYQQQPKLTAEPIISKPIKESWVNFDEGIYQIGHGSDDYAYDNESPAHKAYLHSFTISENSVTNGEYLHFIQQQGYAKPKYWLSLGWDWVNKNHIAVPLYWIKEHDEWFEYTLHGLQPLDLNAPVVHLSYFEADAFARWKDMRLPTEQELEVYLTVHDKPSEQTRDERLHPYSTNKNVGQVWCWSQSHYSAYPGYQPYQGVLEEYNGKFMCNQFVLRGGCIVTPKGHYRHTYRNFYAPQQRWMFSGIRLAKLNNP